MEGVNIVQSASPARGKSHEAGRRIDQWRPAERNKLHVGHDQTALKSIPEATLPRQFQGFLKERSRNREKAWTAAEPTSKRGNHIRQRQRSCVCDEHSLSRRCG